MWNKDQNAETCCLRAGCSGLNALDFYICRIWVMSDREDMWKLSLAMIYAQTQNEAGCRPPVIQSPLLVQFLKGKNLLARQPCPCDPL